MFRFWRAQLLGDFGHARRVNRTRSAEAVHYQIETTELEITPPSPPGKKKNFSFFPLFRLSFFYRTKPVFPGLKSSVEATPVALFLIFFRYSYLDECNLTSNAFFRNPILRESKKSVTFPPEDKNHSAPKRTQLKRRGLKG